MIWEPFLLTPPFVGVEGKGPDKRTLDMVVNHLVMNNMKVERGLTIILDNIFRIYI